jgi:hypothetical protein
MSSPVSSAAWGAICRPWNSTRSGRDRRLPDLRRTASPPRPRPMTRARSSGCARRTHPDRGAGARGCGCMKAAALHRPVGRPAARLDGGRRGDLLRPQPGRDPAHGVLLSGLRREGVGPAATAYLRRTWRRAALARCGDVRLTLLIGTYAQGWHLGGRGRDGARGGLARPCARIFPLPHPSWRNTAWLKRNPWFEAELLPVLRARVREVLE